MNNIANALSDIQATIVIPFHKTLPVIDDVYVNEDESEAMLHFSRS